MHATAPRFVRPLPYRVQTNARNTHSPTRCAIRAIDGKIELSPHHRLVSVPFPRSHPEGYTRIACLSLQTLKRLVHKWRVHSRWYLKGRKKAEEGGIALFLLRLPGRSRRQGRAGGPARPPADP